MSGHAHRDHVTEPGTGRWPAEHGQVLADALGAVKLDDDDRRYLAWLAGCDCPTVAGVAELLRKARAS